MAGVVFALACPQVSPVAGQGLATQLTGGASREWVFKRIVVAMGASGRCTSGETYTFEQANHGLAIRECKNGELAVSRHSWRLANAGAGDTSLVIEGLGTFVLLFRDAADGSHFLRLRSQGQAPTQPTVDKEFRLSED
ncbi:hypothetical protein ACLBYG_25250 [Methylobacterium sp. D53M]